jgi:hypothetical protein
VGGAAENSPSIGIVSLSPSLSLSLSYEISASLYLKMGVLCFRKWLRRAVGDLEWSIYEILSPFWYTHGLFLIQNGLTRNKLEEWDCTEFLPTAIFK